MSSFTGKIALVTGAAAGMSRATALLLARRGAAVTAVRTGWRRWSRRSRPGAAGRWPFRPTSASRGTSRVFADRGGPTVE
ncbi:hypothetical protein [Paractinoplanes deccanensis]|uniref:hypothetical protein n=1 Tax=Paractinoplanes deccanensis TaxID=113561 RepID=UPI001944CBAD|nr:hypothetical protein [Actinoplanes deccanensis]